ncbi:NAD(P)H-dependent oxidoreductase [Brumimicrobium salinarum]|uniref:NAD(P)H-dependent oxidoreductase n=1 Tax=Brumimicrobium salinarum TaxID=2058658 RepID=A0A2I0R745_9FLAO|nr:nitroreductase family protein [Brumimicrobium salinarum]PKR82220.1 NAD(P)H-dependent oxidoreductase [Brumimicrobium salinarum]
MDVIEALNWRYAVKKFNSEKKLTEEQVDRIKQALQLTPTSMGLQLMKFVMVESEAVKQKITPIAYNQPQIEDASHLIVMCRKTDVQPKDIDTFIETAAAANKMEVSNPAMVDYDKSLRVSLSIPEEQQKIWMDNQVYIALGNLMTVCAIEGIDACPMEGFDRKKLNEELGFSEQNLDAVVIFALGYRSEDDYRLKFKKVRRPLEDLFETI